MVLGHSAFPICVLELILAALTGVEPVFSDRQSDIMNRYIIEPNWWKKQDLNLRGNIDYNRFTVCPVRPDSGILPYGESEGARTLGSRIKNPLLYQTELHSHLLEHLFGVEPNTKCFAGISHSEWLGAYGVSGGI